MERPKGYLSPDAQAQGEEVIAAFGDTEVGRLEAQLMAWAIRAEAYEERYHEAMARIAELEAKLRDRA